MRIELEGLCPPVRKVLSEGAPLPMQMLAARGVIPGAPPPDAMTAVVGLSLSANPQVAEVALTTLKNAPRPLLEGALAGSLQREVLLVLGRHYGKDPALLPKLLAQASLDEEIVCELSARADERSGEIIGTNEALLLRFPAAIEKLYMNKNVRMSTCDRLIDLAVRNNIELDFPAFKLAAEAIMSQLIPEAMDERTFDDVQFLETGQQADALELDPVQDVCERDEEGQEKVIEPLVPLFKQLADASISQKVRWAMLGNSAQRLLLIRDTNRLVSEAAARSPRMTENEAAQVSASRAVSDNVLRIIANNREFTRSYQVKLNLVTNPLTPFTFVARLMPHLRTNDLKQIARSKNIPGAVCKSAAQLLSRKK